ncbi:hypothetical protein NEOLI_004855 [Neolecta irregularis DAH-3]|uniref:Uncharacterized protein n=1 Tax=Neolecta irregularis (strain DAH-3) TaxID=1198029 RepID=A0A1U7LUM3_NEOID|nr:hypothetical protein NEOLI_004855 [Neolecta irregularis DAH-3]|eukprot:OLL26242.1 hypothetical protein NEOLI_004855 [Neolecta irregularis DAH-3]
MNRPKFVTPFLKGRPPPAKSSADSHAEPLAKKPRLEEPTVQLKSSKAKSGFRKPLLALGSFNTLPTQEERITQGFYNVLWRKKTNKKNKTWDGDGLKWEGSGKDVVQSNDS